MADYGFSEKGLHVGGVLVADWDEIDNERAAFKLANTVLVTLTFSAARGHYMTDREIWKRDEWEEMKKNLEGLHVWFYDLVGRHSSIKLDLFSDSDLEITESYDIVEIRSFNQEYGMSDNDVDIIQTAVEQCIENGWLDDDGKRIGNPE